ncbi:UDP-N-acetylmuramate--L-alanine ligase [Streptomyces sp. NPDC001594]|uniref:UDP-N-acetylmuramate--L-alanine ligase n=1 Tax=Streptomyces sp. NPDC001594 TaxID=3364590 RepID=UPI0036AAC36C
MRKEKPVHFVGIGGCNMSALAGALHQRGYTVTGSDIANGPNVRALTQSGIQVSIGHATSNLPDSSQLVVASLAAVGRTNPEVLQGEEWGVRTVDRAELLAAIMAQHPESIAVSGTRGKSTTTSLVAAVFVAAGLDPTVSVGTTADQGNYRNGGGRHAIVEACEYHRAFHYMQPSAALILNVVHGDHGDYFKNEEDTHSAFHDFAGKIRHGGLLVTSADCPVARTITASQGRRVTFGLAQTADYQAKITSWHDGRPRFTVLHRGTTMGELAPHLLGQHNVTNILGAVAMGHQHGLELDQMRDAVETFAGAPRRLQHLGTRNGVHVYDDKACTPGEAAATMAAIRRATPGNIAIVLRPTSFSRVRDLLNEYPDPFAKGDRIVVTDIYPGRDTEDFGMHARDVVRVLAEAGLDAHYVPDNGTAPDVEAVCAHMSRWARDVSALVTFGPNDVAQVGHAYLDGQR